MAVALASSAPGKATSGRPGRQGRLNQKMTHIFYHDRCLKSIPKVKDPTQTVYAYFHNNELSKVENLEMMYNLTHLYLQWNHITKMEGLDKLYKLRKLYLGKNRISVLEGLQGLTCLEELHMEKQNGGGADGLCFDPRSLMEIGANLTLLDVSDNKIEHVAWIKPLRNLEVLVAKNNRLVDYKVVADELCPSVRLMSIDFSGNPMCKQHRYRETIVARCCQLRVLDGVNITSVSRTFLQEFDKACRLKQLNARNKHPPTEEGLEDFFNLNMLSGPRSQSAYILRPPTIKPNATILAIDSSHTLVPRCFWRNREPPPAAAPRAARERPPPEESAAPAVMLSDESGLPQYMGEQRDARPRKGILKKPMPMKYI